MPAPTISSSASESRWVTLGPGCCQLPERLLLAHGSGRTLFISGAGTSKSAKLPDFREMTLEVYKKLDPPLYLLLKGIPREACNRWGLPINALRPDQLAEAKRFTQGDYDVALGMLERRIDQNSSASTKVRNEIALILHSAGSTPADIHRALIALADRGRARTIVTTNFDLLLEAAAKYQKPKIESFALTSIPRPGRAADFSGVLHIHGALDRDPKRATTCIVTDQDFGEYYLRRQVVPEFIYDAVRLFNIVLVGYSANDPPMRYLLNAVAADGVRFADLKERFAFVGTSEADGVIMSDWRGRGITPIPYDSKNEHAELTNTLARWADLSQINGNQKVSEKVVKGIVKANRADTSAADRDLFDYLFRRGDDSERRNFTSLVSKARAGADWLDAMLEVSREPRHEAFR